MVQLSLHLTAAVFAPAELCPHGYMYIVHRGICLYGGKVLTSGKVWGEDMILKSPHLRSNYAARCMTYVEVYMIGRDDLIALAMRYPATLKLIRRSAFRLGFRRVAEGSLLLLVVLVLQVVDLIFAVDSVTAKISQYDDIFINFSSSAFAMLCLRSRIAAAG